MVVGFAILLLWERGPASLRGTSTPNPEVTLGIRKPAGILVVMPPV